MSKQLVLVPEHPPAWEDRHVNLSEIAPFESLVPDASFVESVRRFGVLQCILLEQKGSKLILTAGRRRVRAAEAVGLESVPARICKYTGWGPGADIVSAIENEQRGENVSETLAVIERLMAKGAGETEIYEATGIPAQRQRAYLRLAGLNTHLRKAWEAGRIKTSVAVGAAKCTPPQQARLVTILNENGTVTAADVKAVRLADSAFDTDDDRLFDGPEVDFDWRAAAIHAMREAERLTPLHHQAASLIAAALHALGATPGMNADPSSIPLPVQDTKDAAVPFDTDDEQPEADEPFSSDADDETPF